MSALSDAVQAAEQIEGWMEVAELEWLGERAAQHKTIVEIGSFHGRSTKVLALMCPGVVYSIDSLAFDAAGWMDCNQDKHFKENLKAEIKGKKVKVIRKASLDAVKGFKNEQADMIFVDGEHEYPAATVDILAWTPKLAKGGLLCGHDSTIPGVTKSLDEILPGWKQGPGSLWEAS